MVIESDDVRLTSLYDSSMVSFKQKGKSVPLLNRFNRFAATAS